MQLLTSQKNLGKFVEALGSGIGTGSIFCLSFSLSNRVLHEEENCQKEYTFGVS